MATEPVTPKRSFDPGRDEPACWSWPITEPPHPAADPDASEIATRYLREYNESAVGRITHWQAGRCAICAYPADESLRLDHDHGSGMVRGLLCGSCNTQEAFWPNPDSIFGRYRSKPPAAILGAHEVYYSDWGGDAVPAGGGVDGTISNRTAEMLNDSTPINTRLTYDRAMRSFREWCQGAGRTALPCTSATLVEYAAHMAGQDAAPKSISVSVGAIVSAHRGAGLPVPDWKATRPIVRHHRRQRAQRGVRERRPAALPVDDLRRIIAACDPGTSAGIRDRALILLGFAMMARRSELVGLDYGDVTETDYGLSVFIKVSKTDWAGVGRTVVVGRGLVDATCPVRAMRAWRDLLSVRSFTDGALWRAVDTHGRMAGEDKWLRPSRWKGEIRLSGEAVRLILKRAAKRAGVEIEGLSPHSLRHGGATASSRAGADREAIGRKGGWAPGSIALHRYIKPVAAEQEDPMRGVL